MCGADRARAVALIKLTIFLRKRSVSSIRSYAPASEYEARLSVAFLPRTSQSLMITSSSVSDSDIVTTLHCRSARNLSVWVRLAFQPLLFCKKIQHFHLHANRVVSATATPCVTSNNELDQLDPRYEQTDGQDYFDVKSRTNCHVTSDPLREILFTSPTLR